ncbi:MAG: rhodanese-like domain-containing protein [Tannerella sp.]|nr:MAG: rhodanese-like domain-containing protein [Tannerella sp.]
MQTLMIKLLMSLFSVWLSMACAPSEGAEGGITSLTAAEFEALLARDQAVQLVDVRRPDEFAAGHINGAQLIDVTASDFLDRAQKSLDAQRPVAVYCRSGKRSMRAAQMLQKAGFRVIYNLDTGYLGWVEYQAGKKR